MPSTRYAAAQEAAVLRTIPNKRASIAVTTSAVKHDLSNVGGVDLRGKWVWLRAVADLTYLRGDHDGAGETALTVSNGLPLAAGKFEEFWIDRAVDLLDEDDTVDGTAEDKNITVIGAAATTLEILYSDK